MKVCVLGSTATNQSPPFQKYWISSLDTQKWKSTLGVEEYFILESTLRHCVIGINIWKNGRERQATAAKSCTLRRKCKLCEVEFRYSNGSTSTMLNHLKETHHETESVAGSSAVALWIYMEFYEFFFLTKPIIRVFIFVISLTHTHARSTTLCTDAQTHHHFIHSESASSCLPN